MSTVYVGMDIGSKVTAIAARNEGGEILEKLSFKTGKEKLISNISRYGMDTEVLLGCVYVISGFSKPRSLVHAKNEAFGCRICLSTVEVRLMRRNDLP